MEMMLVLFICLGFSYVLGELLKKVGLPQVIGPIFVGLMLGTPSIKNFLFPSSLWYMMESLKEIGLIFLLFYVGLMIDLKEFETASKRSFLIALAGAVFSFILGFGLGKFMGLNNLVSTIIGICLSITAEAISVNILEELKLLKTRVGETIIEAGIIDDLFGIFAISAVIAVIRTSVNPGMEMANLIFEAVVFIILLVLIRFLFVPNILRYAESKKSNIDMFSAAIIITFLIAGLGQYLGIGSIVGALLSGIIIRHTMFEGSNKEKKKEEQMTGMIETITFTFFAPFFFIWIGLNTDLSILILNPLLGMFIALFAFIGKILGSMLGNWLANGDHFEGVIIGWGMSMRGAIGLVLAETVRESGLISTEVFSALVFMVFATTIISPIVFKLMVKEHKLT